VEEKMDLDFAAAINVGVPSDVIEIQRKATEATVLIPSSGISRGLALKSLHVTSSWDRLWSLLGKRRQIYFLSVAFDISDQKPVILPPKDVPEGAVYNVRPGEVISFTLGEGVPIFPARVVNGGLIIYITVCEADRGIRHVGEVMAQVHQDLEKDDSLAQVVKDFIKSPGQAAVKDLVGAATAALQPIATILKKNRDEYVSLFSGIYSAKGPWDDKLTAISNGTTVELRELR
jgi:hypothetical protein